MGRAASLGPLGQFICLDVRLCPLSRTRGTSCGKNRGVHETLSHLTPSLCLHLNVTGLNWLIDKTFCK